MRKVKCAEKGNNEPAREFVKQLTLTLTVGTANGLKAIFAPDYLNTQAKRNEFCTLHHYFHPCLC